MRLDLDSIHAPLNEFIDSLGELREPLELTRNGEIVATVAKKAGAAESHFEQAKNKLATQREIDREKHRMQMHRHAAR